MVLERGRETVLSRSFSDPLENPNFLVQTNHDIPRSANQDENWAGDDPLLNESMGMGTFSRREAAVGFLETIDESKMNAQLMKMLTTYWPVYNSLTIFSSLLCPNDNALEWVVQDIE